ncbi:MAG: hypothetical protein M3426_09400 [Actinomycetota bacterium]|nr:hypothetical protein [Actinomycetota bacterium]
MRKPASLNLPAASDCRVETDQPAQEQHSARQEQSIYWTTNVPVVADSV